MEQFEVTIIENPFEVTFLEESFTVVVQNDEMQILTLAEQGPPGVAGNSTFVQESEPVSGMIEGSFWFNPVTQVTHVYTLGVWVLQATDDGYF
jgi:hypothetical protein